MTHADGDCRQNELFVATILETNIFSNPERAVKKNGAKKTLLKLPGTVKYLTKVDNYPAALAQW